MSHAEIQELLAIYRELGESDRARVDEHLRECQECSDKLETFQAMDRSLANLRPIQPDQHASKRLLTMLETGKLPTNSQMNWGVFGERVLEVGLVLLVLVGGWVVFQGVILNDPTRLAAQATQTPTRTASSLPSPTSTRAAAAVLATATFTPRPTAAGNLPYTADPNILVVYADWQTNPVPRPMDECSPIPDLRVWGDGRVVRVTEKDNKRQVDVGHLSPDRMLQLIAFLKDQGALSPWTHNEPPVPNAVRFSLNVELKGVVIKNSSNQPPTFYPKLLSFFDSDVKPLVLEQAFLVTITGFGGPGQAQDWPARFNISLAQAMFEGIWIKGDALNFVWQTLNSNTSRSYGFRQDGKTYTVGLEIPGITPMEPPAHCWVNWNKALPTVEEITLDQAKQIPNFHLLLPAYLPAGFQLRRIKHTTTVASSSMGPSGPTGITRYDGLVLEYGGPSSEHPGTQAFLSIGESYFPDTPLPPGVPLPGPTPDLHPELVTIRNQRAVVNRYPGVSAPDWVTPEPGPHDNIAIGWHEPDYYYSIGGSLSLEDLVKVGNSLK